MSERVTKRNVCLTSFITLAFDLRKQKAKKKKLIEHFLERYIILLDTVFELLESVTNHICILASCFDPRDSVGSFYYRLWRPKITHGHTQHVSYTWTVLSLDQPDNGVRCKLQKGAVLILNGKRVEIRFFFQTCLGQCVYWSFVHTLLNATDRFRFSFFSIPVKLFLSDAGVCAGRSP